MAASAPCIVSVPWLVNTIKKQTENYREVSDSSISQDEYYTYGPLLLLDAQWQYDKSGPTMFNRKHIPGAVHFDLDASVTPTATIPRNLPDQVTFQEYTQSLGVSSNSHLVFYDTGEIYSSARAWWLFRLFGHDNVSVLDGGLAQWEAQGHTKATGEHKPVKRGDFIPGLCPELMRTRTQVEADIQAVEPRRQLLDSRKTPDFKGEDQEPSLFSRAALEGMGQPVPQGMSAGHLPGSANLMWIRVLNRNATMLPPDELRKKMLSVGVDVSLPMTTTCYVGHTACLLALAAYSCGNTAVAVYYGSWTEWGQLADRSMIQTGPAQLSNV